MIGDFRPLNPYCQCDVSSSPEIMGGNFLHGNTCNSCHDFLAYMIDLKLSTNEFIQILFWATLVEEHECLLITESAGTARRLKFIQEMTVTSNFKKDLTKRRCENVKVFLLCLQGSLECWPRGKEPSSVRSPKFESLWNQIGPRPLSLIPVHMCLLDNWAPGRSSYSPGCCSQWVLWRTSRHWSPLLDSQRVFRVRGTPIKDGLFAGVTVFNPQGCKCYAPGMSEIVAAEHASPPTAAFTIWNSNNSRPFFSRQDLKW